MKPFLVIGAGNLMMGDDGVGCHVARQLAADPRLPDSVDVIEAGTDLLRCGAQMEGRKRVLVVDAICRDDPPGSVHVFAGALPSDSGRRHSHDLSVVDAIGLLQRFLHLPILLMTVSVSSAERKDSLSPVVAARLPAVVDRAIAECGRLGSISTL